MLRFALLLFGFLFLIAQQFLQPLSAQLQFIIFLTGIILLGVPHGAADLLVASQNSTSKNASFSKLKFLINYIGRLLLFALILWFFPLAGNLLFICFAAYHFGETDLFEFKTNTFAGKLFVISYGLVILGTILLTHFEEVKPLFLLFQSAANYLSFINWLDDYRYVILSFLGVFFFISTFVYFFTTPTTQQTHGQFLIQFALILIILYHLPMILGFTFYFILWHSILSLRNIVGYLRKENLITTRLITKQICIYSLLAMAGISLVGLTSFMFVNNETMMVYVFLGLAVLTAPHMQIMHDMYKNIRTRRSIEPEIKHAIY